MTLPTLLDDLETCAAKARRGAEIQRDLGEQDEMNKLAGRLRAAAARIRDEMERVGADAQTSLGSTLRRRMLERINGGLL